MLQNTLSKKKAILTVAAAVIVTSIGVGSLSYVNATHADSVGTTTSSTSGAKHRGGPEGMMGRGIMGTVTAVNGNTLTVTDTGRPNATTTTAATTYTVDVSSAKLLKLSDVAPTAGTKPTAPATITASQIAVGDTVRVEGTVNGTSVTAKTLVDGKMLAHAFGGPMTGGPRGDFGHGKDGERGVMGTISAVSGNTVTVTSTDLHTKGATTTTSTVYSVDATNAKIEKVTAPVAGSTTRVAPTTISVSGLAVGDKVMVQGTVSGTSVTASNIVDGMGFVGGRGGPRKEGSASTPTTTTQS